MSEQVHLTEEQQRQATANLLRDAEWVRDGAKIGKAGSLIVTAAQQQEAESLRKAELGAQGAEPATEASITSPEKSAQETLSEIARESGIAFTTWINGGVFKEGGVRFLTLLSGGEADGGLGSHQYGNPRGNMANAYFELASTPLGVYEKLNGDGVSEIVSFTEFDDELAGRYKGTTAAEWLEYTGLETATLVTYELTKARVGDDRMKYHPRNRYKTGSGGDGELKYQMVMTHENAHQLESMIKADPEVLHQLTDTVASEVLGARPQAWHQKGPLYEQWRELSEDGKNRIAIRHDITQPDGPSQILAY